jgi:hypothetical protein
MNETVSPGRAIFGKVFTLVQADKNKPPHNMNRPKTLLLSFMITSISQLLPQLQNVPYIQSTIIVGICERKFLRRRCVQALNKPGQNQQVSHIHLAIRLIPGRQIAFVGQVGVGGVHQHLLTIA